MGVIAVPSCSKLHFGLCSSGATKSRTSGVGTPENRAFPGRGGTRLPEMNRQELSIFEQLLRKDAPPDFTVTRSSTFVWRRDGEVAPRHRVVGVLAHDLLREEVRVLELVPVEEHETAKVVRHRAVGLALEDDFGTRIGVQIEPRVDLLRGLR